MDYILFQIFKIILNIYIKERGEETTSLSIRVYVNNKKIESRLKKRGYYCKFLTPEIMKLLGST